MKLAAILAVLLLFGVMTTGEAYAKGPIYNEDYTFSQYLRMVLIPMVVAAGVLVMVAFYSRQGVKTSA